jgi:prevent-host-death family protein
MSVINATDAKNKFGQVLDAAQSEPVRIQKNGRDVAVVVSADQYRKLVEAPNVPKVRPKIEELLERSIERRAALYEALAK